MNQTVLLSEQNVVPSHILLEVKKEVDSVYSDMLSEIDTDEEYYTITQKRNSMSYKLTSPNLTYKNMREILESEGFESRY